MLRVIDRWRHGKVKAVFLANDDWIRIMRPAERNKLIKFVLALGGIDWRYRFLRRRIERSSVLRAPFNYRGDTRTPMIHTGEMVLRPGYIWRGKVRAKAQGRQGAHVDVPLPYGHPVTPDIRRVFRLPVPRNEEQHFADYVAQLLVSEKAKLQNVRRRAGAKPLLKLSAGQLREITYTGQNLARAGRPMASWVRAIEHGYLSRYGKAWRFR